MKKVLVISYSFPPKGGGGVLRQLKFTKYLSDFGWQPFVLTVNKRYDFQDHQLLEELSPLCCIFRTGRNSKGRANTSLLGNLKMINLNSLLLLPRLISRAVMVPDRFIFWVPRSVKLGVKIIRENNIHAIYSIDNPNTNHIVGMLLHWITKKPWVADFKDPWTGGYGYKKIPPFSWLDILLERMILSSASQLISVNEAIKNRFISRIRNYEKIRIAVIPNGFDEEDFKAKQEIGHISERLNIAYTGTFYHDMFPSTFLASVKSLIDEGKISDKDIKIIFVGQPEHQEDLNVDLVKKLERIGVLEYKGRLSHKDTIDIIRKSDILLLTQFDVIDGEFIIPSKTFEYIASGKFIIALTNPKNSLSKLILNTGSGVIVHFNDLSGIKDNILSLWSSFKNGQLQPRLAPRENIKNYMRKNLTMELAKILDNITDSTNKNETSVN